jgi:putative addiction module antidote
MHKVKLRKIGNSLGFTIPKEALARLKVADGDTLILTECADGYIVTPYDADFEDAMKIADEGMRRYRNALRELAK